MGGEDYLGELEQVGSKRRLVGKHVERSPGQTLVIDRDGQGLLVNDVAPGGVDLHRGRSHQGELSRPDQPAGRLVERCVNGDPLGSAPSYVHVDPLCHLLSLSSA